ncbi:hypothetical protein F4859DRAFT_515451 [Xylaria cf. heliscus]|nr:hypothetical protein F4859DRAFT_515451 [Xylaria cf. heliscus]
MAQVTFEVPERPAQLRIQSTESPRRRHERSPYPEPRGPDSEPDADSPPLSPISSIYAKARIYYLHKKPKSEPKTLEEYVSSTIKELRPEMDHTVTWASEVLIVDDDWNLRRLVPGPLRLTGSKLVHAYHVYIEFDLPSDPGLDYWAEIEYFVRRACHARGMPHVVIEIVAPLTNATYSLCYTPNPPKDDLKAFFADDSGDEGAKTDGE